MKRTFTLLGGFLFAILAGCSSGAPMPTAPLPTATWPAQTATDTPLPTLTLTPPATFTASPTVYLSPTVTPENFTLAEKGYDIADVRLSFPREDVMVVDFKYRLEESRKDKLTAIRLSIPPECMDDDYKNSAPNYSTRQLVGQATIIFKMTLQGICEAEVIPFVFRHYGPGEEMSPPLHTEYVSQPYRLVRNFPTVNSDTLQVENLNFTPTTSWGGLFTFDFHLSEQIPLPLEQYHFSIYGFGPDGSCPFEAQGALVAQHDGDYTILLRLPQAFMTLYQDCPGDADKYTYTASYLTLHDNVAQRTVYHHPLNEQFTIFKSP